MVTTKIYTEPAICKKEILRYAGCKETTPEIEELLEECIKEVLPRLSYKVCYDTLSLQIADDVCDFGCMSVKSKDLAKNLDGCENIILFAATIGVEIDRLIGRYGHISPAKAMMLQAIGAERIEAVCDAFCEDIESEMQMKLRPRFSPGYGDVALETQRDIFRVLDCSKCIGIALNDSLLMSPSKSVTAFVGVEHTSYGSDIETNGAQKKGIQKHTCANCAKLDCAFREENR